MNLTDKKQQGREKDQEQQEQEVHIDDDMRQEAAWYGRLAASSRYRGTPRPEVPKGDKRGRALHKTRFAFSFSSLFGFFPLFESLALLVKPRTRLS